ncbi:hypothetical protein QTP86_011605 [Hemibagrus guttatus]|nr:hypothetical protein QTP86_011605 [Hemibagrus guttatus]
MSFNYPLYFTSAGRVFVITCHMRQHLQPNQVAQVVQFLQSKIVFVWRRCWANIFDISRSVRITSKTPKDIRLTPQNSWICRKFQPNLEANTLESGR